MMFSYREGARNNFLNGLDRIFTLQSCSVLATLILVVDITLVVVEVAVGRDDLSAAVEELFEILALLFSAYFCAEVALRIIGQG